MIRVLKCTLLALAILLLIAPVAKAGTQDFTLVNASGVNVFALYISETENENWEEDMLGEEVLLDGERIDIEFAGHSACLWDMMVEDEEGEGLLWQGLNLCESSVVVLRCGDGECWAEYE